MSFKFIRSKEHLAVLCFFLLVIATGLFAYRDLGVSTDEWIQRNIGQISLRYISNLFGWHSLFPGEPVLKNPADAFLAFGHDRDRTYGIVFELPAELLIKLLNISESREVFFFRHGLTFFCFFVCLIFFYRILFIRFNNVWLSLLGCSFLMLSPRIFGDAFYNSKDLVFMCFVVICTYTMMRFVFQPRANTVLWHALACALAIDTRFLGALIPAATIAFMVYLNLVKKEALTPLLRWAAIFFIACFVMVVIFWPWLWTDPIGNIQRLIEIFTNLRLNDANKVDLPFIFMGKPISSANIPWYYLPVWIGITTPLPYLALFSIGVYLTVWRSIKQPINKVNRNLILQDQLILTLFLVPALTAMIIRPTFYNGWRHLYFIYPFLIYLCIVAVQSLWTLTIQSKKLKFSFVALAALLVIWCAIKLLHWHPYSYLYFNMLAGQWSERFESDYWGLSYRTPIEKIISQSTTKRFSIFDFDESLYVVNFALLSSSEQSQFVTKSSEACSDYIVIGSKGPYKQYQEKKEFQLFHELKIDGQLVNAVFQRINPLLDRAAPELGKKTDWSNPDQRCHLTKGWSGNIENWGVWSQGKQATINLLLPSSPAKELVLDMRAFINAARPTQHITITVDGQIQKTYNLYNFDTNQITLPLPPFPGKSSIDLNFSIPDAISPRDAGLGEDTRELGIGLKDTYFR